MYSFIMLMQVQEGSDQHMGWWLHLLITALHHHTSINQLVNTHFLILLMGKIQNHHRKKMGKIPFSFLFNV